MPPAIVTPLPALAWCATQPRWLTATGDTLVWATGEADEPGGLFAIRAADLGRVAPRCLLDFAPWRDAGVVCPLGLAVHAGRACLIIADEIVQVPLDGNAPTTLRRPRDAAMLWSIGTWRDELHVATYETTQRELRSLSPVRWGIERVHDGRFERTHEAIQPGDRPVPRFDATDVPTPPWYLADATGVCFDDGDGHVVRIDAAAIPGRLPSGFWPHHAVAVDDGVVMTNHAGEVVHAGPAVGIRLWQLTDLDGDLLVADVLAVVAGCAVLRCERPGAWGEWRLCALPLTGGAVVELFRTPSQITSVAACAGRLFWALANGALGAVDLAGFPRPVPVSVPPNPWRATGAPTADTRPPAADAESPGGRALPAALRSACSAPPLPSDVAVPPWITWPLLALTRYRRQMLALVPHLPPVVTEVDAPLVGRRGVVTCYTWSAAVRARGAAYDQLVFRTLPTRPGCWTLDPTVVDAQAVARWIERRRGPIEERVWRWLPDVALLADLLPQWVEQAGGHTDDGWLQLGAPLEDLIRDEAGPLDDLRLEAFGPLAAALGDVEVHDAASPRCSAVAARHAAFIDGLVDAGRASVGGALPGLRRGPALVSACDRLIVAHHGAGATTLPAGLLDVLAAERLHSAALHWLVLDATPARWPSATLVAAAGYLVGRGLERDRVRQWLRRLAGWDLVGRPAPALPHTAPSTELVLLALALEPAAAVRLLREALRAPALHAVERAVDLVLAIDAAWGWELLRGMRHTVAHREPLALALAHVDQDAAARPAWPRAWRLELLRRELAGVADGLARLGGRPGGALN
jgi:hypothetical protein